MKRISYLLVTLALCSTPALRGQDAATEERLNKLSGQIETLLEGQQALKKQIDALAKELDNVREQAGKPSVNSAGQEDLRRLADALKEVDRKRLDDYEKIREQLDKLRKYIAAPPSTPRSKPTAGSADGSESERPSKPDKGYEYIVQKGDNLSIIVQAYREKNIKVTAEQIRKANPNLKPERMQVGQKIFIPAPQS